MTDYNSNQFGKGNGDRSRLKIVMGSVVSNSQNALIEERQISDVRLIANVATESRLENSLNSTECKLNLEKPIIMVTFILPIKNIVMLIGLTCWKSSTKWIFIGWINWHLNREILVFGEQNSCQFLPEL